jgi:hypothetical protein
MLPDSQNMFSFASSIIIFKNEVYMYTLLFDLISSELISEMGPKVP